MLEGQGSPPRKTIHCSKPRLIGMVGKQAMAPPHPARGMTAVGVELCVDAKLNVSDAMNTVKILQMCL